MLKKETIKEIMGLLLAPLILFVAYLSLILIWRIIGLPPTDELINIVKDFFNKYGLIVIFISAIIEGVLLLGQYFPGGFVIFLGVISAGKNVLRVWEIILVVSAAFLIAYTINYLMGKYGWYILFAKLGLKKSIEKAKEKLQKHLFNAIFFTYWEPNLSSITATAAGILKISFRKFIVYSIMGVLIWNIVWASLVFFLGETALHLITGIKYILIIFVIWISIILIKHFLFDRRKRIKTFKTL